MKSKSCYALIFVFITFYFVLFQSFNSFSQPTNNNQSDITATQFETAPVKLDGNVLFDVRGVTSLPAEKRAYGISEKIKKVASNYSFSPDSLKIINEDDHIVIQAADVPIIMLFDADAAVEGVTKNILARTILSKLSGSIKLYRLNRSRPVVIQNLIRAGIATVILALLWLIVVWGIRRLNSWLQNRIKARIDSVENISFKLIQSNQLWKVFHLLFDTLRVIAIGVIILFFIDYVLGLFPWTNGFSKYILSIIVNPLLIIGKGFIHFIPDLIFLVIIYVITKYVLKLLRLFFDGIENGGIVLGNFKPEWAFATYRIVKNFIVVFAVIIAYPYIPGSDSVAFKGVSVFLGVLISLGSSSFIANIMAGYSMIYRGAFKKGDRIQVDSEVGFVEEQKLMVTRLRSHKNEEIIIPNSVLLNSKIINYTARAQELGLILHTTVGIGYETPWRQVDAMLKLAADRTEGILKDPAPFVLKKELADFAVNYEINVYCKDVPRVNTIYTLLDENILDVFNENNVQIMTPAYHSDPEVPKMVPKEQWNTPLANET